MKALVIFLAALGFSLSIGGGQELSLVVLPIVEPHRTVSVTFDGSKLISQRGNKDPIVHPLTPAMAKAIQKVIGTSSQEAWSGHWASTVFLDGYEIVAKVNWDGKKLTFSGSNGCPAGFSKIVKVLYEATELEVLRSGWAEREKSSKRYKSREDFFGSTIEEAKYKRDEGSAEQPPTAPESKPEGVKNTKPESEGRSQ